MKSVRGGQLNRVPNTTNAPLVEKPYEIRTSQVTKQSAKRRTELLVYPCLAKMPFAIRTTQEIQRIAKHRRCASSVPFPNGEAIWNSCDSSNSIECQTPYYTFFVPMLSEEAICNPYESGNYMECETSQIRILCAFVNGDAIWNPLVLSNSIECQTPHYTSFVPLLSEKGIRNLHE